MHRFLSIPVISWVPPIAKMMKKKRRMIIVSLKSGIADKRACMSTFSPLILEIVLRGLSTLKTLRLAKLKPDSSVS